MTKKDETASLLALIGGIISILQLTVSVMLMFLIGSLTLTGDSGLFWMLIMLVSCGFSLSIAITAIFLSIRIRKKVTQAQGIILIVIGSLTILSQLLPSILFIIAGVMLLIHYKNNVQPK